jgi:hypothetical protein
VASAFAPVSPFVAVETGFASFIIGADVAGNFSRVLGVETPTHPDGRAKAEYLGRLVVRSTHGVGKSAGHFGDVSVV